MTMLAVCSEMNGPQSNTSKPSPSSHTSYSRVDYDSLLELQSGVPRSAMRKRSKKYRLLVKIAIVGFVAWGSMLLISYIIDKQFEGGSQNALLSSSNTHMLALTSLHLLQATEPKSQISQQTDNASKAQALTNRLQQLRMHNVLRKSNTLIKSEPHSLHSSDLGLHETEKLNHANIQMALVKQWEQDFLLLKN